MSNEKFYIVTGLPRSGTSLVAGILHNLGIDMIGGQSPRKDNGNPTGYFERMRVVNSNVNLTNSKTFVGVVEGANLVSSGHVFDIYLDGYNNMIDDLLHKNDLPMGVKDPRFCYPQLLDVFTNSLQRHMPSENIKVLLTYRDIFSIIDSLTSVDDRVPKNKPAMIPGLLDTYLLALTTIIKKLYSFKIVSYERLVVNPQKGVQEIADFCGVSLTPEAVGLVDQKLKRF